MRFERQKILLIVNELQEKTKQKKNTMLFPVMFWRESTKKDFSLKRIDLLKKSSSSCEVLVT